jgi:hypothetical protein
VWLRLYVLCSWTLQNLCNKIPIHAAQYLVFVTKHEVYFPTKPAALLHNSHTVSYLHIYRSLVVKNLMPFLKFKCTKDLQIHTSWNKMWNLLCVFESDLCIVSHKYISHIFMLSCPEVTASARQGPGLPTFQRIYIGVQLDVVILFKTTLHVSGVPYSSSWVLILPGQP